jgi:hypothetical protein
VLRNRVITALLALLLLVAAIVCLGEIIAAQLNRGPWLLPVDDVSTYLQDSPWSGSFARAVCIGLVILGLVLVVAGVRRGRPRNIPLQTDVKGLTLQASRRSLERVLSQSAELQDGVATARAKVGRRSARVTAVTRLGSEDRSREISDRIRAAVDEQVQRLRPARSLSTRVAVRSGGRR